MKAEDIAGSWISDELIRKDGSHKKRGLLKGKLDIAEDGTAVVKAGFLKADATWSFDGDDVILSYNKAQASAVPMTLVDGSLHMMTGNGVVAIYHRA